MTSRRTLGLMAVLLLLVLGALARPAWESIQFLLRPTPKGVEPLAGEPKVEGLVVRRDDKGQWVAEFDYFYPDHPPAVLVVVETLGTSSLPGVAPPRSRTVHGPAIRGRQHVRVTVRPPVGDSTASTQTVTALLMRDAQRLAAQTVDQTIDWARAAEWARDAENARRPVQDLVGEATRLIDSDEDRVLPQAKNMLEAALQRDARLDAAYLELARIAMKTRWGPEGLHQAEGLIASARAINPESVNAKILLGYVYAHQGRHREAEALLAAAEETHPPNLWLWTNWGELKLMQGQVDAATAKFREALRRPPAGNSYDRARRAAYYHLRVLLWQRKDLDGVETLLRQRRADYGQNDCEAAGLARFVLDARGRVDEAISLAEEARKIACASDDAREVLGLAHYTQWAAAPAAQRTDLLNRARVYLPGGPRLLYQLAVSEHTAPAARALVGAGEPVDQQDNQRMTALALAMQDRDHAAARRLLRLGARADTPVGAMEIPVALLPVLSVDLEGIRLMQQSGVDYAKLAYRGMTALQHAQQSGDRRLIEALSARAQKL